MSSLYSKWKIQKLTILKKKKGGGEVDFHHDFKQVHFLNFTTGREDETVVTDPHKKPSFSVPLQFSHVTS